MMRDDLKGETQRWMETMKGQRRAGREGVYGVMEAVAWSTGRDYTIFRNRHKSLNRMDGRAIVG